jgi:NAD(P)-dependent dehydrogenase (short-subunit alcohol dehydrogenase family)
VSRREPAAVRWIGRTALVTGASSGIGRALALDLARRGARVFVTARRADALKLLVEEMGGDPHQYVVCDVGDLRQVRDLAETVAEQVDYLDVLVNNAGIRSAGPLSSATSEDMEAVIRTNLLGPMFCTRELLPLLEAAPATLRMPVVANVASIAGRVAIPRSSDYTASKFGLVGMTESLWHDLTASGIKVMMVNPGPVDTEGFPMAKVKAIPGLAWTVMEPARVARAIVRGIERGAFEVRVQWWFHPVYHAAVLAGSARLVVATRLGQRIPLDFEGPGSGDP